MKINQEVYYSLEPAKDSDKEAEIVREITELMEDPFVANIVYSMTRSWISPLEFWVVTFLQGYRYAQAEVLEKIEK